ncbi:MAG: hypothetical protein L3J33_08770 [Rhodobacteraceae bacterium]|nr:hypothetical protein [Paracoccaceae bacterium]
MNCSIFTKTISLAFVVLSGCTSSDPLSQLANSFVGQLYSGMKFSEYVDVKNQFYPPVGGGEILAIGCLNAVGELQSCNEIEIETDTKLTYSFNRTEMISYCEANLCFPSNLAEILSYDNFTENTQPIADRIQAGLAEWGSDNGVDEFYVFFDDSQKYLIGIMFNGDLDTSGVVFNR